MLQDDQAVFSDRVQKVIEQNRINQEKFKQRSEKFIQLNYPPRSHPLKKFMKEFFDIFIKLELLRSEKQIKTKLK